MARSLVTGIDVGSAFVRVVVCEYSNNEQGLVVRALVKVPSDGLKNGYVVNADTAGECIGTALSEAGRLTGQQIKRATVAVGGVGLSTIMETATIAISRADGVVSEFDVTRAVGESEARVSERPNTKILHTIPSEFKVDGRKVLGKPLGHVGAKLEIRTLFVTAAMPHVEALFSAIEAQGTEVSDFYAAPIAESMVTLTPSARNAGSVLVNLGAETVSLVTYEDSLPTSLKVFPLGSVDITNDIALGLRVSLEEAEQVKLGLLPDKRPNKKVGDIISARFSDIFELIDTHLKKIGRSGLLPAGVIFTGEAAHSKGIEELARKELGLPAKVAKNFIPGNLAGKPTDARVRERLDRARDPEWSVALGLCVLGLMGPGEESLGLRVAKRTKSGVIKFLRQFLP